MNQIIDIGINLMHEQFRHDRLEVLQKSIRAGVSPLIITGTSVQSSKKAAEFATQYPKYLYSTAGIHPHDAKSCDETTIESLRQLCKNPQVVAIGECGLDYDRDFSPRDIQQKWFKAQIELAIELDKPLFLHERAAFNDFIEILKGYPNIGQRCVVHCFTGTKEELEAYLELGCMIGITGWICDERRGQSLREIIPLIPDDRLMIETDGPFLLPRNLSVKPNENRNEPIYLPHIANEIARLRRQFSALVTNNTTANAKRFFKLI